MCQNCSQIPKQSEFENGDGRLPGLRTRILEFQQLYYFSISKNCNCIDKSSELGNYQDFHLLKIKVSGTAHLENQTHSVEHFESR